MGFAVLTNNGNVYTWGSHSYGGNLDGFIAGLLKAWGGVSKLYANHVAFAAVTNTGRVVTGGDQSNGGNSSSVTSDLVGVKYIEPSGSAFTAVVDSNSGLSVQ